MITTDLLGIVNVILLLLAIALTPGPNNILLASTGMNHGYKKGLPQLLGLLVGMLAINIVAYFGVNMLSSNKLLKLCLNLLGFAVIFYLGFMFIRNVMSKNNPEDCELKAIPPLTFKQSFLMQWVNTAALSLAVTCATISLPFFNLFWYLVAIAVTTWIGTNVWILGGKCLSVLLKSPKHYRIVNLCFGVLLIITAFLVLDFDLIKDVTGVASTANAVVSDVAVQINNSLGNNSSIVNATNNITSVANVMDNATNNTK